MRPKRESIGTKDYRIKLLGEGSENSEEEVNASTSTKKQSKNIISSDSSGSDNYDPTVAKEGKGKERESSMSDQGDTEIDSGREEGANDGEISGVEDSDIASDRGGSGSPPPNRKGETNSATRTRIRDPLPAARIRARPIQKVKPAVTATKPRKGVSSRTKNDPVEMGFHPLYEPPTRTLDPITSLDTAGITCTAPSAINERLSIEKSWALFPFGPLGADVSDLGWWKGKWKEKSMNEEWGGWYRNITINNLEVLSEADVCDHLPSQVFASRPTKVYTGRKADDAGEGEDGADGAEVENDDEEAVTEVKVWMGSLVQGKPPQKLISMKLFESQRLDDFLAAKPGHVFNAGGSISGAVWLPRKDSLPKAPYAYEYAAISTIGSHPLDNIRVTAPTMIQIWSLDTSNPDDSNRDTSEKDKDEPKRNSMKFEFGLCIDTGEAWDIKWCPRGGQVIEGEEVSVEEKMGIIAGVFTDGNVSLFAVPSVEHVQQQSKGKNEGRLYVHADPLLKLEIEGSRCLSFAWGSHEMIAGGCMNGHVAIWAIGDAMRAGSKAVRPIQYFPISQSCIRSLVFVRTPPPGEGGTELDPEALVVTGHDGSTNYIDLRTEAGSVISHERTLVSSIAYCSWTGSVLFDSSDHRIKLAMIKPEDYGSNRVVAMQRGMIWSLATSDFHPFLCSTSADGTCLLTNTMRSAKLLKKTIYYVKKVYRLDFNRLTGEYRMIDNLLPEQKPTLDVQKKAKAQAQDPFFQNTTPSAAWSPQIAVTSSDWSKNIRRSGLLISGMACGLGRIDWVDYAPDEFESKTKDGSSEEEPIAGADVSSDEDFQSTAAKIKNLPRKKAPRAIQDDEEGIVVKKPSKKKVAPKIIDDEMDLNSDLEGAATLMAMMQSSNFVEKPVKKPRAKKAPAKKVVEKVVGEVEGAGEAEVEDPPVTKKVAKPSAKKTAAEKVPKVSKAKSKKAEVEPEPVEREEAELESEVVEKSVSKAKKVVKPKATPKPKEIEVEEEVEVVEEDVGAEATPQVKKSAAKKPPVKKDVKKAPAKKEIIKKSSAKKGDELPIDEDDAMEQLAPIFKKSAAKKAPVKKSPAKKSVAKKVPVPVEDEVMIEEEEEAPVAKPKARMSPRKRGIDPEEEKEVESTKKPSKRKKGDTEE